MVDKGNRLKALLGGKERISIDLKEKLQLIVTDDEIKKQEVAVRQDNGLNGKTNQSLKHQTFLVDINELNQLKLKMMEYNIKTAGKKISQSELIRMFISYTFFNGIEETIKIIRERGNYYEYTK